MSEWLPKERVLVPVDFSDPSFHAVEVALEHVAERAHVKVVHVLPQSTVFQGGVLLSNVDDDEAQVVEAETALNNHLRRRMLDGVAVQVVAGDPGTRIAEVARADDADLVVLPSHGRTGLAHLLMGSVAERVVRLAPCPVLVLRMPPEE